jgi:hydroxypyruvate reductase
MNYKDILLKSYKVAYEAALPKNCLPSFIPSKPKGKVYVIGAGKAAADMARVFEEHCDYDYEGLVVTRYGHVVPTKKIKVLEAAHPVPDEAGANAAKEILSFIEPAQENDLVICLLSGGGSALLTCPVDGISFEDIQALNKQLLSCGASIHEINTIRKHLNQAFGGKLCAAAAPAKIVTLAISDVAGDDPSTIASGPTVGDPTTLEDCLEILAKYNIEAASSIMTYLQNANHETPKPDNDMFDKSDYQVIAAPQQSLMVAATYLKEQGFEPLILSSMIEGDTDQAAHFHSAIVKQVKHYHQPLRAPCALLSGGETTVTIRGDGTGGPNTQLMLAAAIELDGVEGVYAIACDTDGIDGAQDNAGGYIDPSTLKRAQSQGLSAKACLANNDSEKFFTTIGDIITPGPTYTNVNDFRVFLIT